MFRLVVHNIKGLLGIYSGGHEHLLPEITSLLPHVHSDSDMFSHFVLDCTHECVMYVLQIPFSESPLWLAPRRGRGACVFR